MLRLWLVLPDAAPLICYARPSSFQTLARRLLFQDRSFAVRPLQCMAPRTPPGHREDRARDEHGGARPASGMSTGIACLAHLASMVMAFSPQNEIP